MTKIRTSLLRGSTALAALITLVLPRASHAQADINPPLTNALLLVDTSGSMEYKADGTLPTCNPASSASVNEKSRWIDVIEVLTGTINDYRCQTIDRTDSSATGFKTGEYALGGPPYDFLYPLAYHRPLSGNCAPAPGAQSSNPFIYPASGGIKFHTYNGTTACTFSQPGSDGVLDSFRNLVRFGLMTFDTSTGAGTGFSGAMSSASADSTTGKAGLWSYVPGTVVQGSPAGCAKTDQEVGARNGAAPAWEGRLVNFGNPYDGVRAYEIKNDHIQDVLRATRPYGATPIAGMLQDASDFLLNDANKDPDRIPASLPDTDLASDFGPYRDPYLKCAAVPRKQMVILLSDGQPNMDLRPYCALTGETPAGVCPFLLPEVIAGNLDTETTTHHAIPTFVVGFGLDDVDHDNNPATPLLDCNTITATDVAVNATSLCGKPASAGNAPLQACCTLQRIAIAGGATLPPSKRHAYFASDRTLLRNALGDILSASLPTTSRTQAVASAGSGSGSGGGFQFFTGFVPTTGEAWRGTLERRRIICTDPAHPGVPWPQQITVNLGDDFERNLAVGGPNARRIYTVLGGANGSDPLKPLATIRPTFGSTDKDGVGTYSGRDFSGNSRYFIDNLPAAATAIPAASCINENGGTLTTANCQKQYLEWWAGYNNGQSTVKQRCPDTANCHLLGDIMHSTPVVVDRPIASIRDESYTRFTELQKYRPKVLYTSTNDGMLHAFKVASNDPAEASDNTKKVMTNSASNELWAFVPPAVQPSLYSLYPNTHQPLLDGMAAVQDVVAVAAAQADKAPTVFERSRLAAQQGSAVWRTILVQGFGSGRTGYFALDVTNPIPDTSNPDDTNKGGARMLWQLTTDKVDGKLFGRGGGTPAIATLYFDPEGGTNVREIPVAILPGGPGGTMVTSGTGCPATARTFSDVTLDTAYPPRGKVHCYNFPDGDTGARSLTIVRLDTGEIVRSFRQSKLEVAADIRARVTEVGIDSPITGQPVAFPSFTGEVADRVFVGDLDGRLWRVNVASANPANWTMKLFMDLYPSAFGASPGKTFADGQPIIVPPVLSVDLENNLVINVATGDQDSLGAAPTQSNFVYSLTEKVNTAHTGYATKVNWYKQFTGGSHVVGPMTLFNGGLFFGTFTAAPGTDVCQIGTSEIWGMNYLTPQTASTLSDGGKAVLAAQLIQSVASAVAFGPSVMQQPSCATDVDSLIGDGVLGFGHQVSLSNIQTGAFQLVFQTGSNTTGSDAPSAAVGVKAITLPTPPALSTVSAWASIVE